MATRAFAIACSQTKSFLFSKTTKTVISAIHDQGGDVLKLIGDGTLAMFAGEDRTADAVRRSPRRIKLSGRLRNSSSGASGAGCRQRTSISAFTSAKSCTGISAAANPRFHRGRSGCERGQPHRRHVSAGRSADLASSAFFAALGPEQNRWSPSAAMRCAALDKRRIFSRSSGRDNFFLSARINVQPCQGSNTLPRKP